MNQSSNGIAIGFVVVAVVVVENADGDIHHHGFVVTVNIVVTAIDAEGVAENADADGAACDRQ